jgi:hypothetical protein
MINEFARQAALNAQVPQPLRMKTQVSPVLWALALLALFSASNLASAYYDPGVQRWINRDPIRDSAFQSRTARHPRRADREWNLFSFLEGGPSNKRDHWGLLVFNGCTQKEKDDITKALKDSCSKAKSCALLKCDSQGPNRGIGHICDYSKSFNITCAGEDDAKCKGNCGHAEISGDDSITVCPNAWSEEKCPGGLKCTLFHEALHSPGGMSHKDSDFKRFEDCMGCESDLTKD